MLVDVLRYETPDGESLRAVEAGRGRAVVEAHRRWARRRRLSGLGLAVAVVVAVAGYGVLVAGVPVPVVAGVVAVAVLGIVGVGRSRARAGDPTPELVAESVRLAEAASRYDLDVTPA